MEFKNVPNIRLRGHTFDAAHLSHFVSHDQIESNNYYTNYGMNTGKVENKKDNNKSMANPVVQARVKTASNTGSTRRGLSQQTRRTMKTQYMSLTSGLTNIRPSQCFVSVPRNSVAYVKSELPQKDSIIK